MKREGGTLLNRSDFLLQKLHFYGEALNLREAMAPCLPISAAYGLLYNYKQLIMKVYNNVWKIIVKMTECNTDS